MFFKAILTSEGLAKTLIDEVDPIAAAEPYIRAHLRDTFGEERIKQDAFYHFVTLSTLARRLPTVASQLPRRHRAPASPLRRTRPRPLRAAAAAGQHGERIVITVLTVAAFACGTALLVGGTLSLVQLVLACVLHRGRRPVCPDRGSAGSSRF